MKINSNENDVLYSLSEIDYLKNNISKSYHHPNLPPKLRFKIFETEPNIIRLKILEAYYISLIEPKLNNEDECLDLKRFLI